LLADEIDVSDSKPLTTSWLRSLQSAAFTMFSLLNPYRPSAKFALAVFSNKSQYLLYSFQEVCPPSLSIHSALELLRFKLSKRKSGKFANNEKSQRA